METITDTLIVRQDFPVTYGERWKIHDASGKLVEEWFIDSDPKQYGKTRKSVRVIKQIFDAQDCS